MKRISVMVVLLLTLCSFKTNDKPVGCLELDLFLLADVSSSVESNLNFVADAMTAFVDKFELSDQGVRIGVVSFESTAIVQTPLTSDREKITNAIEIVRSYHHGSMTNMSDALTFAANEFMTEGRQGAMKIIVVITDGNPTDEETTSDAADQLKKLLMVGICGVLVNNNTMKPDYLKSISSDYCYVESNYDNLVEELKKMDVCL